jgi:YVTN family beta-propeller protein
MSVFSNSNTALAIDAASNTPAFDTPVKLASSANKIVFAPGGKHAYVTHSGANFISVIDTAGNHGVADSDVLERYLPDFEVHIGQHRPHSPILADDIRRVDCDLLTVTLARVGFDHFERLIAVHGEPHLRGGLQHRLSERRQFAVLRIDKRAIGCEVSSLRRAL